MSQVYLDVMTVSLTVNCCALLMVVIPRVREKVLATSSLKRYKTLTNICRHYAEKPLVLSKILSNQVILCLLVISSIVSISASDVIRYPFHSEIPDSGQMVFIKTLFSINIGRYIFIIVEMILSTRAVSVAKSRANAVHHIVTVVCYILFLAYEENLLIGLVGILTESTSVLDDVSRYCKERDRRHTKFHRRLVVFNCVGTICFRGVIPTVFLVIAMFQQSPFTMAYVSLTVFFLSIIFFSVINVWQILLGLQRLFNQLSEKSRSLDGVLTETEIVRPTFGTLVRHNSRGAVQLKIAKNNLGYVKPYENKNIASYTDEKHNMNNRKECAKETLELHVSPEVFLKSRNMRNDKSACVTSVSNIPRRHSVGESELRDSFLLDGRLRRSTVLFLSGRAPLRDSNSSTSTSNSDTVLIYPSYRGSETERNNSSLNNSLNNNEEHTLFNRQTVYEDRFSTGLHHTAHAHRLNGDRNSSSSGSNDDCH